MEYFPLLYGNIVIYFSVMGYYDIIYYKSFLGEISVTFINAYLVKVFICSQQSNTE